VRQLNSRSLASSLKCLFSVAALALACATPTCDVSAQALGTRRFPPNLPVGELAKEPAPTPLAPLTVATGNDLYCAGFINSMPTPNYFEIVGAEEENTKTQFAQGDVVYLNAGRSQGVEPGLLYTVVRPLGTFRSPFAHTSGERNLGVYTQELGVLRVFAVQETTATARIVFSCGTMQFGDLLRAYEERRAPVSDVSEPLPRYEVPACDKPGRIVLQREMKEVIGPRDVVYIDLGKDEGVQVGDRFTIFRLEPDDARIVRNNDDEIRQRQSGGFESDTFRGGKFSIDAPRKGRQRVKNERPALPPKIVGELVVIAVQGKSATAIVTRTTQEVHTGDWVEVQK
jgi:hypothetical protein